MCELHGGVQLLGPKTIEFTEATIAISIRVGFTILQPEQALGYTLAPQLSMDVIAIWIVGLADPRCGLVWGRASGRAGLHQ